MQICKKKFLNYEVENMGLVMYFLFVCVILSDVNIQSGSSWGLEEEPAWKGGEPKEEYTGVDLDSTDWLWLMLGKHRVNKSWFQYL